MCPKLFRKKTRMKSYFKNETTKKVLTIFRGKLLGDIDSDKCIAAKKAYSTRYLGRFDTFQK